MAKIEVMAKILSLEEFLKCQFVATPEEADIILPSATPDTPTATKIDMEALKELARRSAGKPQQVSIDRNECIKQIKDAFKARGLRYSVTGGRGTAWGWITIDLLPSVYKSLDEAGRQAAYRQLGDDLGEKQGYTSVSIPASSNYYREYIDRASGRTPSIIGQPYWD